MKSRFSLRFLLISVCIFSVAIASLVTLGKSFSARMNAAMEARKLSQYLWQSKGDFDSACDLAKLELPDSQSLFLDNWQPSHVIVDETYAIAYRTKSSSGLTYFVTDDYLIGSASTRVWVSKVEQSEQNQQEKPVGSKNSSKDSSNEKSS